MVNKSSVIKAIDNSVNELDEYDSEISDIEDNLGGLYKRIAEVIV